MPLQIVRNDITRMTVDAIVNAANSLLAGGGGVDGAIHRAAGPKLDEACEALGGCRTGEAKATEGFDLACRHIIHTVGPVWRGGEQGEPEQLAACYRNALALAEELGCESVAFPLISAGTYGFPNALAMRIALNEIMRFLENSDMEVYLVVYSREAVAVSSRLFEDVAAYIDDNYVEARAQSPRGNLPGRDRPLARRMEAEEAPRRAQARGLFEGLFSRRERKEKARPDRPEARPKEAAEEAQEEARGNAPAPETAASYSISRHSIPEPEDEEALFEVESCEAESTFDLEPVCAARAVQPLESPDYGGDASKLSLDDMLAQVDEGFGEMLLRKIDEKRITDAQCYRRANIDRRLFNKIKNNPDYRPGKQTVLAFAIALELSLPETQEMLMKAGYALSHSSKSDIIVEYCILHHIYDIITVNQLLFQAQAQAPRA